VTYLLIAFLAATFAPLLVATWRTSLLGLGIQGLLLTALLFERGWPTSASGAVLLVDLALLRSWFVPRHLYVTLRRQETAGRRDVLPASLLTWVIAGALTFVAFEFAGRMCPQGGDAATHVAVATAALLLSFLLLATERRTFGQVVGALQLENAIALFELAGEHELPLAVQLGVTGVLLLTVLTFGAFVRHLRAESAEAVGSAPGSTP
jgi:hydrogenase-4 membrane subunit HyfE